MSEWRILALAAVAGGGALIVLRIISNEIALCVRALEAQAAAAKPPPDKSEEADITVGAPTAEPAQAA